MSDVLALAWAIARERLARGGKAGYLTHGAARWLVVELPLYGRPLQVSYAVDAAFAASHPLPPFIGPRYTGMTNERVLALYGAYIANALAVTAPPDAPAVGPTDHALTRAAELLALP